MAYEVSFETVEAQPMAGVSAVADRGQLAQAIRAGLDKVWPVLRAGDYGKVGCNVVLYHPARDGRLSLCTGVRLHAPFPGEVGEVRPCETPAGEVAHVVYFGDYSKMLPAHQAAQEAALKSGRGLSGASWEVYGDWFDDWAKVRTDIYYQLGDVR
jgi:effector-binding domain-containing protein